MAPLANPYYFGSQEWGFSVWAHNANYGLDDFHRHGDQRSRIGQPDPHLRVAAQARFRQALFVEVESEVRDWGGGISGRSYTITDRYDSRNTIWGIHNETTSDLHVASVGTAENCRGLGFSHVLYEELYRAVGLSRVTSFSAWFMGTNAAALNQGNIPPGIRSIERLGSRIIRSLRIERSTRIIGSSQ